MSLVPTLAYHILERESIEEMPWVVREDPLGRDR